MRRAAASTLAVSILICVPGTLMLTLPPSEPAKPPSPSPARGMNSADAPPTTSPSTTAHATSAAV